MYKPSELATALVRTFVKSTHVHHNLGQSTEQPEIRRTKHRRHSSKGLFAEVVHVLLLVHDDVLHREVEGLLSVDLLYGPKKSAEEIEELSGRAKSPDMAGPPTPG